MKSGRNGITSVKPVKPMKGGGDREDVPAPSLAARGSPLVAADGVAA